MAKCAAFSERGSIPIGLEPDFPGLIASSVRATGSEPGEVEPVAFASFYTFTYAVLTLDSSTLTVQVKGMPAVRNADDLLDVATHRRVREPSGRGNPAVYARSPVTEGRAAAGRQTIGVVGHYDVVR